MARILVVLAIALGVLGQLSFGDQPPFIVDGVLFYAAAVAAFTLGLLSIESAAGGERGAAGILAAIGQAARRGRRSLRLVVGLLVSVASSAASLALLAKPATASYLRPVALWGASWLAFLVAVLPSSRSVEPDAAPDPAPRPPARGSDAPAAPAAAAHGVAAHGAAAPRAAAVPPPRLGRNHRLAVLALLALALALRLWRVWDIPYTLAGDEGSWGKDAIKVLSGELRNPFTTGFMSQPTMGAFFQSFGIALFGPTVLGVRFPSTLFGAATVLLIFFLVRRLRGDTAAWISAVLLATYHFHIHYSRLGLNNILDGLFMSAALLFLVKAAADGRRLDWALAGGVTGLAQYGYQGARLTVVVVALACAVLLLAAPADRRRNAPGLAILTASALVVAAPMVQFAILHPNDYNARLNQIGVLQSGWLELAMQQSGRSAPAILFDQLQKSALAFNAYADRSTFYWDSRPLLEFLPAILFVLGLGYATLRPLDWRTAPMTVWWWSGVVLGGMLTVDQPASQRLLTLAAPTCFFVAVALEKIVAVLAEGAPRRARAALLAAMVVVIGGVSLHRYFFRYTPSLVYGSRQALISTHLAKYANLHLDSRSWVYFFGSPVMYFGFPTLPYLAPTLEGVDVEEPFDGAPSLGAPPSDRSLCFVFLPHRLRDLELVRQSFPGGELIEVPVPNGESGPLYVLYNVRRSPMGAASDSQGPAAALDG
jgi:4-amino-4-deoxy-L-arabinose transferase-like glycosyltransferase